MNGQEMHKRHAELGEETENLQNTCSQSGKSLPARTALKLVFVCFFILEVPDSIIAESGMFGTRK